MNNDMEARQQIVNAKALIKQGRLNEARRLLRNNPNPLARKLLLELDEQPDVVPVRVARDEPDNEDIEIRTVIRNRKRSIWEFDENVPPIVIKLMALDLFILLVVLPGIRLIQLGEFRLLIGLPLMIALIPLYIFVYYLWWKLYWGCTGIIAFFMLLLLVVAVYVAIVSELPLIGWDIR